MIAIYTIRYSPHQVPLAKALIDLWGEDSIRYISAEPVSEKRRNMGWECDGSQSWHIKEWENRRVARDVLEAAEILITGQRDVALIELRAAKGLRTIYCSERWFKPPIGILRLVRPSYYTMARRFVRLLSSSEFVEYFPMGIHAARDMARLCGVMHASMSCLFGAPEVNYERKPCGRIWHVDESQRSQYCLEKMRMWGYFVEPSNRVLCDKRENQSRHSACRVLWVGQLLDLKRVEDVIKAVIAQADRVPFVGGRATITLDIYGAGPAEARLKKLAARYSEVIKFYRPVPIHKVRALMRVHDVYVLSSDAHEGWGAVVSEALEEGMKVVGTYEAGSCATMLPDSNLYHAGDWQTLLRILNGDVPYIGIGEWSVNNAARTLTRFLKLGNSVRK